MAKADSLITDHIDIWTSAIKNRSSQGRGSNKKIELTGIKKLRELILELAVRGQLVPQDPNDEPAAVLLEKIAAEKAQLIKDKRIKKAKVLPEIGGDEKPFGLPDGWAWLRLIESYYSISPSGNKLKGSEIKEEGNYPVVDQGQSFIAGYTELKELLIEIPQPVIVFGDHTTNIKYIDFNFVAGADGTKILSPILIYPRYFYTYLLNYNLENRGYARHFKVLNDNLIAIPPLAEQHRIVAKVDELMALCDQLEQQTEDSITAHKTLVETLLATLTRSENTEAFHQSWARIAAHFDTLFTTEHSIDQLKQTVLQLAVMGKLVPQNPNDEPASVLLEKIAAEKEQLIKDKVIKKQKALPAISEDEKPFELPSGWEWVILQNITSKITDGDHQTPPRISSGYRLLSAKNVRDGYLEMNNCDFIAKEYYIKSRERCLPECGDLLIVSVGGTIGRSSVVPADSEFALVRSVALIKPMLLSSSYFKYAMDSKLLQASIHDRKRGGAQPCLYLSEIGKFPFSLPPLTEQHRIVKKVDELLSLCDQLKSRLSAAQTTQLHLADTLVKQAVN